ncbi:MAG: RluA family pseudouridine synthase [Pseudomonadota bacterium]|nr:RluA family pseudouridine synthase [Pseudomonadota bacterium]
MNIVQTLTVTADEAGMRLDRWFRRHFPQVTHGQLQKLLRTGQVRVAGKRASADTRVEEGQAIRIPPLPSASAQEESRAPRTPKTARASQDDIKDLQARVLYRDDDVLVINKPAGMAVQGGTGVGKNIDLLLDVLQFEASERPRLVHRLDRDTSGVLVLARTLPAARRLGELFRGHDVRKYYWAVTVGTPVPFQGRIDLALSKQGGAGREKMAPDEDEGKNAVTLYSVVEPAGKKAAWVALWPVTGRTHQLRAHMAAIGTPILGDGKYAGKGASLTGVELSRDLHLHARRIILPHPRRGMIDVTAPLPDHMKKTWKYFGFHQKDDGDPFAAAEA